MNLYTKTEVHELIFSLLNVDILCIYFLKLIWYYLMSADSHVIKILNSAFDKTLVILKK